MIPPEVVPEITSKLHQGFKHEFLQGPYKKNHPGILPGITPEILPGIFPIISQGKDFTSTSSRKFAIILRGKIPQGFFFKKSTRLFPIIPLDIH